MISRWFQDFILFEYAHIKVLCSLKYEENDFLLYFQIFSLDLDAHTVWIGRNPEFDHFLNSMVVRFWSRKILKNFCFWKIIILGYTKPLYARAHTIPSPGIIAISMKKTPPICWQPNFGEPNGRSHWDHQNNEKYIGKSKISEFSKFVLVVSSDV